VEACRGCHCLFDAARVSLRTVGFGRGMKAPNRCDSSAFDRHLTLPITPRHLTASAVNVLGVPGATVRGAGADEPKPNGPRVTCGEFRGFRSALRAT
jgi:hypothetical protein